MIIQKIIYIKNGVCNRDKCNSACCRNLFNPSDDTLELLKPVNGICQYLDQDTNKCTLQDTNKPPLCKTFPYENNPFHHNYLKVKDVCSFWFEEEIEEIDGN